MSRVRAESSRTVAATPDVVYGLLADYVHQRPRMLPDAFRGFTVLEGGVGAGTLVRYELVTGTRERAYRLKVEEPAPGRELVERDTDSSLVNTWTVNGNDGKSVVRVVTEWDGAGGVGGLFERAFAPAAVRRIYGQVLDRLASITEA